MYDFLLSVRRWSSFHGIRSVPGFQARYQRLEDAKWLAAWATREQIRKILGAPTGSDDESATYKNFVSLNRTKEQLEQITRDFPDAKYGRPDLQFDDMLWILIKFRSERARYLFVASSTC